MSHDHFRSPSDQSRAPSSEINHEPTSSASLMDPLSPNPSDPSPIELLLQNVIQERNALRAQNDQLWKIIDKQRNVILQLQNQLGNSMAAASGKSDEDPASRLPSIRPASASHKKRSVTSKGVSNSVNLPHLGGTSPMPTLANLPPSYPVSTNGILSNASESVNSTGHFPHLSPPGTENNSKKSMSKSEPRALPYPESTSSVNKVTPHPPLGPRPSSASNAHHGGSGVFSPPQIVSGRPSEYHGAALPILPGIKNMPGIKRKEDKSGKELIKTVNISNFSGLDLIIVKGEMNSILGKAKSDGPLVASLFYEISVQDQNEQELFRIEKAFEDFFELDEQLASTLPEDILSNVYNLPDPSNFSITQGSPFLDQKAALETYLECLVKNLPSDQPEFLRFLQSDHLPSKALANERHGDPDQRDFAAVHFQTEVDQDPDRQHPKSHMQPPRKTSIDSADGKGRFVALNEGESGSGRPSAVGPSPRKSFTGSDSTDQKEGFLTKKGKSFGGATWKRRYFVLHQGLLDCYESKNGNHSGTIKLKYCVVTDTIPSTAHSSKESNQVPAEIDAKFLICITEYKKGAFQNQSDGVPDPNKVHCRYLLYSDSSEDRDEWVARLQASIDLVRPPPDSFAPSPTERSPTKARESMAYQGRISASPADRGANKSRESISDERQDSAGTRESVPHRSGHGTSGISVSEEGRDSTDTRDSVPIRFGAGTSVMPGSEELRDSAGTRDSVPIRSGHGTSGMSINQHELSNPSMSRMPETPPQDPSQIERRSSFSKSQRSMSPPGSPSPPKSRVAHLDDNERIMNQSASTITNLINQSVGEGKLNMLSATPAASVKPTEPKKPKKNNFNFNWGRRKNSTTAVEPPKIDRSRMVFGVSLDRCVETSRISDQVPLPAIVYRCVEYLDAKNAINEEGIYRLSGSSSEIQQLKERFNNEGDVDLLGSGEFYDVHAVAGLLKLWFRELTSSILTQELAGHFSRLTEISDREEKIARLVHLMSLLPLQNYLLLRVLVNHLIGVVQNHTRNKMTVRNVVIVFAPTVSVPAGIFNLMMSEYDSIFIWNGNQEQEKDRRSYAEHGFRERYLDKRQGVPRDSEEALVETEIPQESSGV